uniref:Integrase catalytic domain-containing protein n=1 Tax=Amphiprion percula TaxID=161767 RepID=A0A3P8S1I8_AMPPE
MALPKQSTTAVIQKIKGVFARYGIPDEVVSDNGPQFSSAEFKEFAKQFDFKHCTSSPHHPQGNGHVERAVQTAKKIMRQDDPLMALMCYRSTPCSSTGYSPAELLMGRKIRTTLPVLEKSLLPKWPNRAMVRNKDSCEKIKHAYFFNRRHGARALPVLQPGDAVFSKLDHEKSWSLPATVQRESTTPRSIIITTSQGTELRRNRRHLQSAPIQRPTSSTPEDIGAAQTCSSTSVDDTVPVNQSVAAPATPAPSQTVTRSGRVCKPVHRMDL